MRTNFDILDKKILEQLERNGSMRVEKLAKTLNVKKREIILHLHSSLQHQCFCDENFYWSLIQDTSISGQKKFDEQEYFTVLEKDAEKLEQYLLSLNDEILKIPHILFVKPIISGYIFSEENIFVLLNYLKSKGIDLNSNEYFLKRTDDLKGIDLIGGCLGFPIYYFVQGKKELLQDEEISMYSSLVKNARKMGWNVKTNLSNNKNIQDLLYLLLSRGHHELQPVYDALFENIALVAQANDISKQKEITNDTCPVFANMSLGEKQPILESANDSCTTNEDLIENTHISAQTITNETDSLDDLMNLLNSLSINGYIDDSFINIDNQIGLKIQNMLKILNYGSAKDFIASFGLKVGTIEGNVIYDFYNEDISESEFDNDILNTIISDFSTRASNILMRYGVRTYNDLINLDLEEFKTKKGVGMGVIREISKRIRKIQLELVQNKERILGTDEYKDEVSINFNWRNVFTESEGFKSLFNVSIPASIQKNEVLSHMCLKSDHILINKNFIKELTTALNIVEGNKEIFINSFTKAGDIGASFSALNPGDLVKIKISGKIREEVLDLVEEALKNFSLTVTVGNGSTTRSFTLDLPPFTALFVLECNEELPSRIAEAIDIIIEPKFSHNDLVKLEILDSASRNNLKLTEETLSFLIEDLNDKHANSSVKLLSDYLYLHPETRQPISIEKMKEILYLLHN